MQLSLEFEPINIEWVERINQMLDSINDGRRGKDIYRPLLQLQINDDLIVFAAENEISERWFNILKTDGSTPKNLSANWRSLHHIIQELKEII